jgi:hypothetical protein
MAAQAHLQICFCANTELWRRVALNALPSNAEVQIMDGIIYLVGLIVIVMAILSFFGLR